MIPASEKAEFQTIESMQAARLARESLKPTPESIAKMALDIVETSPSMVRECQAVASLNRTILQRVVCMLADKPTDIHIGLYGSWSATLGNGGHMSAYEKLDYHVGCRLFLETMRAAGIPIIEHGYEKKL